LKPKALLVALLFACLAGGVALAAPATDPASGTQSAGPAGDLGPAIRAYLLAHPEVVLEAIQELQRRQQVAEAEASRLSLEAQADALYSDAASPVLGNPEGDVIVVEFFDYNCGYCKRAAPEVAALLAADPNVKLVMKEFPILGPDSILAARSALAAGKQGRYGDFHDALFLSERTDHAGLETLASSLGLDMDRFRKDRDDPATSALLDDNASVAEALGIKGTPAFVVDNQLFPHALDAATLVSLVQAARSGRAQAAVK